MKLHLRSLSVAIGFVMSALVVVGPTAPVEAFEELQPLTAISPVRVLDTRIGVGADAASVGPDETITLDLSEAEHAEFRADRFIAAINHRGSVPFALAYVARAVSPGDFHHPAALVEDMYRPEYRAITETGAVRVVE